MLPERLRQCVDRIAGAGNDVQREQVRSIVADYDAQAGEAATEAQLRLLLPARATTSASSCSTATGSQVRAITAPIVGE